MIAFVCASVLLVGLFLSFCSALDPKWLLRVQTWLEDTGIERHFLKVDVDHDKREVAVHVRLVEAWWLWLFLPLWAAFVHVVYWAKGCGDDES